MHINLHCTNSDLNIILTRVMIWFRRVCVQNYIYIVPYVHSDWNTFLVLISTTSSVEEENAITNVCNLLLWQYFCISLKFEEFATERRIKISKPNSLALLVLLFCSVSLSVGLIHRRLPILPSIPSHCIKFTCFLRIKMEIIQIKTSNLPSDFTHLS